MHKPKLIIALITIVLMFTVTAYTITQVHVTNTALGDQLFGDGENLSTEVVDLHVQVADFNERKAYRALWTFDAFIFVSGLMIMLSMKRED